MAEQLIPQPSPRLAALDTFRGLAVAGMIIVNTPGSGEHVWWPLDHAAWHGFTPTDLVFPAFLCAVGVALGLSFPRRIDATLWKRVIRRTLLLIAIGWAWQMLARPGLETFRIFGVLPRIGLCYFLAAALAILTARRGEDGRSRLSAKAILGAAIGALVLYGTLLTLVPVPGYGPGQLTPEGNLAGWLDRTLFTTAHIWRFGTDAAGNVVYDPEGLLSTMSAFANVLLGMLAAIAWRRAPDRAVRWIAIGGIALITLGLALAPFMPINKRIWTPSFAVLTSGLSAILLVLCVLALRSAALRKLLAPFDIFGMNAILGYILSLLIGLAGMRLGFQAWGFGQIESVVGDPWLASFLYSLAITLIVLAALVPLHRRGIHLRL
ncbi:MAG: heparan-alpha-glucosaminide N-acetyltransferase domain-containing protein [Pseudomonadota bacterium]